ncbi:hypothetical protein AA0473_1628 [Acetobacter orleanensis NRIC 0473]|nr:hypothetical protein AA0473_1628 [Acetobacter orleanensis NRIC 0473]
MPSGLLALALLSLPLAPVITNAAPPSAAATSAAASPERPVPDNYRLLGTLGPYPIGATLSVLPNQSLSGAHYFYMNKLVDIPLSGQFTGEQLTLSEPGGGHFTLHLEAKDKKAPHPLTLQTSTALVGTWTNSAKTYPVTLTLSAIDSGAPGTQYQDVTNASPAAFEAMVQRFLHSVLSGDKAETAKLISWPLRFNGDHPLTLKTPQDLFASWSHIFTPCMRTHLQNSVPHDMFVHNSLAMVDGGTVWFDANGATAINSVTCPHHP